MKSLLTVFAFLVVGIGFCQADEKLSDERLVDLVAGSTEVGKVVIHLKTQVPSDETPRLLVSAPTEGTWLQTSLPTKKDYDVREVAGRGVIFTHKQAKSRIVLVRAREGKAQFVWRMGFVAKDATGPHPSVRLVTVKDRDNQQFQYLLASIVP